MFGKKKKRSFIDRLTGSVHIPDYDDDYYEDGEDGYDEEEASHHETQRPPQKHLEHAQAPSHLNRPPEPHHLLDDDDESGELAVDVFETPDEIIVKAMVAGVKPADLDIDIARDMVTIHGVREYEDEIEEDDYYHKELYWGSFKRTVMLPEEIDVDLSEATERHGLLVLRLPKVDKARKAKLRVKSEK